MNVIAVDWSKGADNINYIQAAANTRVVGATIGELLKTLHSTGHSNYNKIHLVGHSLGSHISGYAGAYVHGAVGKITGKCVDLSCPYTLVSLLLCLSPCLLGMTLSVFIC